MSHGEIFKTVREKLRDEWKDVTHSYRDNDQTKVSITGRFAYLVGINTLSVRIASDDTEKTRKDLEEAVLNAISESIAKDGSMLKKIEENLSLEVA